MSTTCPDIDASAPLPDDPSPASPVRPSKGRPVGHPAVRLRPWLWRLTEIGDFLVTKIRGIAASEATTGQRSHLDIKRGWDLVSRAVCWMHALKARLAAQRRMELKERLFDGPDLTRPPPPRPALSAHKLDREIRRALRHGREDAVEEIAGLATAEVVLQVCADLAEAASVLECAKVGRVMAALTASARTMLDELGDAVTVAPMRLDRGTPDELRNAWAQAYGALERMMAGTTPIPPPATPDTG